MKKCFWMYKITWCPFEKDIEQEIGFIYSDENSFSNALEKIEKDYGDTIYSIDGLYPLSSDNTLSLSDIIDSMGKEDLDKYLNNSK